MKTLAKALFTTMLALSALSIAKADDDHEFIFSLKGGASYIPVTADAEINMGVFLTKNLSANLGIRFQETGEEYISGEKLSYEWSFNERIYNMLFPLSIRGILPICKNEKRAWQLIAEPGAIFQLFPTDNFTAEFYGYKDGKLGTWYENCSYTHDNIYVFWSCKFGMELQLKNSLAFSLGYEMNNQDPYKKRRKTVFEDVEFNNKIDKRKQLYHYAFVTLSYYY